MIEENNEIMQLADVEENNEIMQLADIVKWLEDKRLYMIAKRTGLTYPTLAKLLKGGDCRMSTIIKLSDYIKSNN